MSTSSDRRRHQKRVALVTGASRGFGRAVAAVLVADGWWVVVDGRDRQALQDAAAAIGAHAVAGDVTDDSHRRALMAAATGSGGRLDLLVNNAGDLGPSPLPSLSEFPLAGLAPLFDANVTAPLALTQLGLPALRAAGGAVINVTSDAAVEPYPGWGGYGAAKAALEQMSAVLAVEEPEITVWWVDPGDMRTRMHQQAFPGEDISDRRTPEEVAPALVRLLERRPASGRIPLAPIMAGPLP